MYICPGCLYLNIVSPLIEHKLFYCQYCEKQSKNATLDLKIIELHLIFKKHHKSGIRCLICKRFLPKPLDGTNNIICPYPDCSFIGNPSLLKGMWHPINKNNQEITSKKDLSKENKSEYNINTIKNIINRQSNIVFYDSVDHTKHHKILIYQAFTNLLSTFPTEMHDYLLCDSRMGGFQHKIFQEYIKLLEESLPFSFKKNGKVFSVDSLLNDNLSIFNGISKFDSVADLNGIVKNNTQELYIGGRKGAYCKPYYIGKLLSLEVKNTLPSIMKNVVEYSFLKIKLKNVKPGTIVTVTHLSVPPHYQMGGMSYINRIRKNIIKDIKTSDIENM